MTTTKEQQEDDDRFAEASALAAERGEPAPVKQAAPGVVGQSAKCPECGEEIDYLMDLSPGWSRWIYRVGGDYSFDEEVPGDGEDNWYCPNCGETLATNEEDADKILRGEPEEAPKK